MAINLNRTPHEVQFNAVKIGKLFIFIRKHSVIWRGVTVTEVVFSRERFTSITAYRSFVTQLQLLAKLIN